MDKPNSLWWKALGSAGFVGILGVAIYWFSRSSQSTLVRLCAPASIDISPDGQNLVCVGDGQGRTDLYILNLANGRLKRLTDSPEEELHPRFSPDGTQLVYSAGVRGSDATGNLFARHLYIYDMSSGTTRQITDDKNRWDDCPSFSADGKYVVFSGSVPKAAGHYTSDIFVVEVATGQCHRLTQEAYNGMTYPRFWHDDTEVLFTASKNSERSYLASVSVRNPQMPVPITPLGAITREGYPLPDGKILLISENVDDTDSTVGLFDTKTRTYDILASSNPGPCSPVAFKNSVYWWEVYGEIYHMDLTTREKQRIIGMAACGTCCYPDPAATEPRKKRKRFVAGHGNPSLYGPMKTPTPCSLATKQTAV